MSTAASLNFAKDKATEGKEYLNILRVVGAFAVVLLHSNEGLWVFSYDPYWLEATVVQMALFFAVPCFIMISGALLIDYSNRYTTKAFLKKRLKKTLIPYIAWCLIGIVYLSFRGALDANSLSIKTVISMIINNEVLPIYWFFPTLLSVYLLTPVLTYIPENKRRSCFQYIIFSMLILNIVVPFFCDVLGLSPSQIQSPISTICLYYITGYYVDKYLNPKMFKVLYFAGFLGFLVLLVGTITASYKGGSLDQTYMGYTNLPCYLYSVGIFCMFKQLSSCTHVGQKTFGQIAALFVDETLGIYVVHWYVLDGLKNHFGLNYTDFMYRIPMGIVAFFFFWLFVKVLRVLPIVKSIVP